LFYFTFYIRTFQIKNDEIKKKLHIDESTHSNNAPPVAKESDFFHEETLNASAAAANLATPVNLEAFEPKIADKSSEGPSVSAAALGTVTAENASTQIKSNILGQKKAPPAKKVIRILRNILKI
jgi:hypothetical protein